MKRYIITGEGHYSPPGTEIGDIAIQADDGSDNYAYYHTRSNRWCTSGHYCSGRFTGEKSYAGWNIKLEDYHSCAALIPSFNVGDVVSVTKKFTTSSNHPYYNFGSRIEIGDRFTVRAVDPITGAVELMCHEQGGHQTKIDPRQLVKTSLPGIGRVSMPTIPEKELHEAKTILNELDSLEAMIAKADEITDELEEEEEYEEEEEEEYEEEEDETYTTMDIDEQIRQADAKMKSKVPDSISSFKWSLPLYAPKNTPEYREDDYWKRWAEGSLPNIEEKKTRQFTADENRVTPKYTPRKARGLNFRTRKII